MVLVVVLIVALLYYAATPNVQQPKFRWIPPGAVVAIVVWMPRRRVRLLRLELLLLQQDLRLTGGRRGRSGVPVDHQPGTSPRAPSSTPSLSGAGSSRAASPRRARSSSPLAIPATSRRPPRSRPRTRRKAAVIRQRAGKRLYAFENESQPTTRKEPCHEEADPADRLRRRLRARRPRQAANVTSRSRTSRSSRTTHACSPPRRRSPRPLASRRLS